MNFQLSPGDLPPITCYDAADNTEKAHAGVFWYQVGKNMTLEVDCQPRFWLLLETMSGMLLIFCSSCDYEDFQG